VAGGLSEFRSPEDAARYQEMYDDFVARSWPVPHEELDVLTRFGTTRVRRSGAATGPPLVMIHPTTGSSAGWSPVIAPLCARHTVYTPDTIGTAGRSIQRAAVRSVHDLVTWLDEVLDGLGLDAVHMLGYSEGGWIAGTHAALSGRPDRLTTLTLVEPGGAIERVSSTFVAQLVGRGARALIARDKRRAVRRFSQWMNGDAELTDEQIDLLLLAMRTFRQRLPVPGRLTDEELRRITTPTLVLLAADTKLYDPEVVAGRARQLLEQATVEIVPNAGHGVMFQAAELVTTRILEFIDAER
jgi:pimeloyl-ACP methyl ester carboxylesterase